MQHLAAVQSDCLSKAVFQSTLGIAGVNTRPLHAATLGIAGNLSSNLRPHIQEITVGARLGDRAASRCWSRASYLLDYTYLTCPSRATGALRYRSGFRSIWAPENRRLPLYLDSGAYRESAKTAPSWSSYTRYCQAIDLVRPEGAMSRDVMNDQELSLQGYRRMCSDGYQQTVIPVWQVRPSWDSACDAAANGRLAAKDSTLRGYADQSPIVAIGGLVRGPCPRVGRYLYLAELAAAFPDTQFWALGQASATVINGLGRLGLLERISTDGAWWIHHARTEQFAVLQDGVLRSLRLTHTGASSFFTLLELMAANLRSLLSAYSGLWTYPGPAEVPTDLDDSDVQLELRRRFAPAQLELFERLG